NENRPGESAGVAEVAMLEDDTADRPVGGNLDLAEHAPHVLVLSLGEGATVDAHRAADAALLLLLSEERLRVHRERDLIGADGLAYQRHLLVVERQGDEVVDGTEADRVLDAEAILVSDRDLGTGEQAGLLLLLDGLDFQVAVPRYVRAIALERAPANRHRAAFLRRREIEVAQAVRLRRLELRLRPKKFANHDHRDGFEDGFD